MGYNKSFPLFFLPSHSLTLSKKQVSNLSKKLSLPLVTQSRGLQLGRQSRRQGIQRTFAGVQRLHSKLEEAAVGRSVALHLGRAQEWWKEKTEAQR